MTTPTPDKPNRSWLYMAAAFVAFWAVYLAFFAPATSNRAPALGESTGGRKADYSWRLTDLDGKPVELSQYKGKAVFLNVWATWCGPCVRELPSIARLAADPKLKDVAFLCVATDTTTEPVKRFLEGKGWPMTVLHATDCPPVFATEGIPATFLIAPDGRIAASEVGSAEWDDPKVVALLESLVKQGG